MWCTILNVALLCLWTVLFLAVPNIVYRTQHRFFPISREAFDVIMYCFLGAYKLLIIVFALAPWLALLIVGASD